MLSSLLLTSEMFLAFLSVSPWWIGLQRFVWVQVCSYAGSCQWSPQGHWLSGSELSPPQETRSQDLEPYPKCGKRLLMSNTSEILLLLCKSNRKKIQVTIIVMIPLMRIANTHHTSINEETIPQLDKFLGIASPCEAIARSEHHIKLFWNKHAFVCAAGILKACVGLPGLQCKMTRMYAFKAT